MRRHIVTFFLILGFVAGNMYIVHPRPDSKKRTLLVEVQDTETERPVPGALIQVSGSRVTVLTDSLGLAHFPAKTTLSQRVSATCPGFDGEPDTPWWVAADSMIVRLELVPTWMRTVTGIVEDSRGKSLSDARVWITTDTAVTDSAGRFVLGRPHISPHDLRVFYAGLPYFTRDVWSASHETVAVRVVLYDSAAKGDIVGRVSDGWTGNTVTGARLQVVGMEPMVRTGVDGRYAFRNLKPGDYKVVCSAYGSHNLLSRVAVRPGQRSNCDFHPCGTY